jgi:hypothetical protein
MSKTIYCTECESIHRAAQSCKPWEADDATP